MIGMTEYHLFNSYENWMHLLYEFIYWMSLELDAFIIWHTSNWFEYTSLHFMVQDVNYFNSNESSYIITCLS